MKNGKKLIDIIGIDRVKKLTDLAIALNLNADDILNKLNNKAFLFAGTGLIDNPDQVYIVACDSLIAELKGSLDLLKGLKQ